MEKPKKIESSRPYFRIGGPFIWMEEIPKVLRDRGMSIFFTFQPGTSCADAEEIIHFLNRNLAEMRVSYHEPQEKPRLHVVFSICQPRRVPAV